MSPMPRPTLEPRRPDDLAAEALRYIAWMRERGYAAGTYEERQNELARFVAWCSERGITRPAELTLEVLELYQTHLAHRPRFDDPEQTLALQGQRNYLIDVRQLCKWLRRRKLVAADPGVDLVLPRTPDIVPRSVLTRVEVERVMAHPDVSTVLGLRDRAILETLYSTGIRRAELVKLATSDLDLDHGMVLIRVGKWRKDRVVPIGERAVSWVTAYLERSRPQLQVPPDDGVVFLSNRGRALTTDVLTTMLGKLLKAAGITKRGAVHIFRHTMATHMLDGGADTRYIQHMLGHSDLATTQVYTRVAIARLKEVHTATHPGARLRPRPGSAGEATGASEEAPAGEPSTNRLRIALDEGYVDDQAEPLAFLDDDSDDEDS